MQTNSTFNQVIAEFKTFADSHSFLKHFGLGLPSDLNAENTTLYPVMWVVPLSGDITYDSNTAKQSLKFEVIFGDIVSDGADSNAIAEVLSDTLQTAGDFVAYIFESSTKLNITSSSTLTPWLTLDDNSLTGWAIEVLVDLPFYANTCYPT